MSEPDDRSSLTNDLGPVLRLYRAPWVVPVEGPVLRDGAVAVGNERIATVGPFADISRQYPHVPVTDCAGALLPALVNSHIHLELACYGPVAKGGEEASMCDWIRNLLAVRESSPCSAEEREAAACQMVREQHASGVGLLLDIQNVPAEYNPASSMEIISLLEMLGPTRAAQEAVISSLADLPEQISVTGHAPYSTGPDLLKALKERARTQGRLFSLHLAENRDELLLLQGGEGCFASFLQERQAWDQTFPIPAIDSRGVVGYLDDLTILDGKTLCVHCVHLGAEEINLLAASRAHVCLCPGSNRFLGVGTAPVEAILAAGILPALGTDSRASNPCPDLWQEMRLLAEEHPGVEPATILAMATLGGARALGRSKDYGSLTAGRLARFLHVQDVSVAKAQDEESLLQGLVSRGRPENLSWVGRE